MTLRVEYTAYGKPAVQRLGEMVRQLKDNDPLAPVTVVVSANTIAIGTRRLLGSAGQGIAAAHFLRLNDLAERLAGAQIISSENRMPLSDRVRCAVVRNTLAVAPGLFKTIARHPSTEQALVSCYKELREIPDSALDSLAAQSRRAADVVRICRQVRSDLKTRWYDESDLIDRAVKRIKSGTANINLSDSGPIIVYLPQSLTPSQGRFIAALTDAIEISVIAGLTGNANADATVVESLNRMGVAQVNLTCIKPPHGDLIVSAADEGEEMRIAVEQVVEAAREGIPLSRIAVLCGGGANAIRHLHEHLLSAQIPFNGPSSHTLADSLVGRGLIALLQLEDRGFRRSDIFDLLAITEPNLSNAEQAKPTPAPVMAWERISRQAGVAQGFEQWATRLNQYAIDLRSRAEDEHRINDDPDLAEYRWERFHKDADHADSLARFTAQLIADLTPDPAPATWVDWCRWVGGLIDRYIGDKQQRQSWPDDEQESAKRIESALANLAELNEIEPNPRLSTFRASLLAELASSTPRINNIGKGVLTGRIGDSLGMELDRVILVGLVEGIFPHSPPEDPLLPDRERKVTSGHLALLSSQTGDLHRSLLTALASARHSTLIYARGDSRRGAEQYPSRWLLDSATKLANQTVDSPSLESFANDVTATWFKHVPSFSHRVANAVFCANAQEHRLHNLLRYPSSVEALWGNDCSGVNGFGWDVDDTVLRYGAEMVSGRASDHFTRFDGNLAGHHMPEQGAVSPTSLEAWADCPMRYFFQRVLRVQTTDDPENLLEISPLEKGSLVHKALEDFLKEQIDREAVPAPRQPWSEEQRTRLLAIAERLCDEVELRGLTGAPVYWHHHRKQLIVDLDRFLIEDNLQRQAREASPIACELAFGEGSDLDAIPVELPNGQQVLLRGKADRVDATNLGYLQVTDYKTGNAYQYRKLDKAKQGDDWDPVQRGTRLQLPVYGLAARAQTGNFTAPVRAQYWFVTAQANFKTYGFDLDQTVLDCFRESVAIITEGIQAGVFCDRPQADKSDGRFSQRCEYCNPDRLGTSEARRAWERKRTQPELAAYRDLCEPIDKEMRDYASG
ncbi:MAG: hypothetical protein F4X48_00430 [Acidimicrobiia bacterium]|nr:hypothetical protein [Acidimicrobiia bacterium]MYC57046.1 hypothetical protein [Acidimicrobiia bacterium]MYI30123.1 hypothetical protein [Acidimicrobiia bacterium]